VGDLGLGRYSVAEDASYIGLVEPAGLGVKHQAEPAQPQFFFKIWVQPAELNFFFKIVGLNSNFFQTALFYTNIGVGRFLGHF